MAINRSCGVLLPISALPSPYGIGTLGQAAYEFVDFLAQANQSWWQLLPVGPTSFGDSPYQSFSAFAGNPYFVDLDMLCGNGLLLREEIETVDWGGDAGRVDYGIIYQNRFGVLHKAFERGVERDRMALEAFVRDNAGWLPDYALYMAVKEHFGMRSWTEWEDAAIRLHTTDAVRHYTDQLSAEILFYEYIQYLFFQQWNALRAYARKKGIGIIGDLPIYVAMDSADVWAAPEYFQLDSENIPAHVAGVPPDYFNADGQLWGNPLYAWDRMKQDGYGWWIRRVDGAARLYDILRIDHFRGFESYWAVPFGSTTARVGRWVKGPGMALVGVLTAWFDNIQFIAEDLGYLTDDVRRLVTDSGFPGMKVLEFAFDSREPSNYLPHTYGHNCVCYAGTHDNAPVMAWRNEAAPEDVALAERYLGLNDQEGFNWGFLRGGLSSVADLFIAQMQDYLGLDALARMNIPGTLGGNWLWRLQPGQATGKLAERMAESARMYGRSNGVWADGHKAEDQLSPGQ